MIRKIILNALQNKKPVHLILHVTDRCELRCQTCFNKKTNNIDLHIEDIKKLSKYIDNPLWLEISGGEPFLRKDLLEICALFNTNLISISTNGQNPKGIFRTVANIRKKLEKSIVLNIAVSIDGFQKTNDYIRGKNSFSNALKTLNLLKKIPNIKVKVNTVLCKQNYKEILEFMKFIQTLRPDFHSIILLRGKPKNPVFKLPSLKELTSIKEDMFKIWAEYNYGISNPIQKRILQNYQRLSFETSLKIIGKKEQIPKCLAGIKHLVIKPGGNVSFCEMLNNIGNIKYNPINEILKSKKASVQRKKIKTGKCFCYHNCNMLDNFFLNPSQYFNLLIRK